MQRQRRQNAMARLSFLNDIDNRDWFDFGQQGYGQRIDGTEKGYGYFGELPMRGGGVATELSYGPSNDLAPLIVPTLSVEELYQLLQGMEPSADIFRKADEYKRLRRFQGSNPFAEYGEWQ